MTLIVEDGSGLTNSNSYAGVSDADAYHLERANAAWGAATNEAKEGALIRATDFINASYVFKSVRLTDTQALECPRYPDTALNPALVKATIELALHALTVDLNPYVATREVTRDYEELTGVGRTEKYYDMKRPAGDPFPLITKILKPIAPTRLGSDSSTVKLTR